MKKDEAADLAEKKEIKEYCEALKRRKSARANFESMWQECANYILPRKDGITSKPSPGQVKGVTLFDSTAPMACEFLAGALHGMLTNPASQWFGLTTGERHLDDNEDVRAWLENSSERMLNVMNQSNFQTEVHELYMDQGWCGTAAMLVEEDDDFVVNFSTKHMGGVYLDENHKGRIDTVFFVDSLDARKLVQRYGERKVGRNVLKALKDGSDEKFEVLHVVYPRKSPVVKDDPTAKGMPIGSKHILVCDEICMEESGYREMPWVTPRWTVVSGEVYGRGPGAKALPEIRMINEMDKTILDGAQRQVNPPVSVPDDGFIMPLKLKANGINFRRSGNPEDRIEPIFNDSRIDFGYQALEDRRKRIREAFYVDQLQLGTNGPQMTATEVNTRNDDKLRIMGPMLGRQQSEFLAPLINRVFGIMLRRGLFEKPPAVLSKKGGMNLGVKYLSSIARAQKMGEGNNILRGLQTLAPIQAVNPDIMDNFDPDETTRFIALEVYGFPQRIMRKVEDRDALRKGRADAQAQAVQMQQQQHQAELAKTGAAAVKDVSLANQAGGQLAQAG